MRIGVNDFFFGKKRVLAGQIFYYFNVGLLMIVFRFYFLPGEIRHFFFERAVHENVLNERQVEFLSEIHVVFAESRRDVDDAGAGFGRHKIRRIYFPAVCMIFKSSIFGIIVKY